MNYSVLTKSAFLIICLTISGISNAEVAAGPTPNNAGKIGLEIVASGSARYIKDWISTPSDEAVTIKRIKNAYPEQLIVIAFLVTGMTADQAGNYSFSISVNITEPDGRIMFGLRGYAKGQGRQPNRPTFIMADPALDLILESSDPAGVYKIIAEVTDLVTMQKSKSSYEIRLYK